MENKKYLPLKIVHLIFMVAAMALCVVSLVKHGSDTSVHANPLAVVCTVLGILCLIAGFIYLVLGYKKNAAVYYKIFMALQLTMFVILLARIMNIQQTPLYMAFLYLIPLVMLSILSVAKDLGKTKTMIVALICVFCRVINLVISICVLKAFGTAATGILANDITNLLLAGTTAFMVCGKYLDKAERGTK